MLGALGVLLLYIPFYMFPKFFAPNILSIAGQKIEVPIIYYLYSIFLVVLEIILLTLTNLWVVKNIAYATGYHTLPNYKETLLQLGLEKKHKDILQIGINPLQGLNPKLLFLQNLLFILKATLTNLFGRIIIQRLMGRQAVKYVQDFIGIPIFAFWNIWAMKEVLRNARVVILARPLIEKFTAKMADMVDTSEDNFYTKIYDCLQFIALCKRDFHYNHFLLSHNILIQFNLPAKKEHIISDNFISEIANSKNKFFYKEIIELGFILDGKLSNREKIKIKTFSNSLNINTEEIKEKIHRFINGNLD